jgi:diguanylate cyclase (GGDEF)-like protein
MTELDPRTISFMSGLMGAIMGIVLFGLSRNYPPSIGGLRLWTSAPLVCFLGALAFAFERQGHAALASMLGNGLVIAGIGLFFFGSRQFFGLPLAWRGWAVFLACAVAGIAWFEVWHPDYRMRLLIAAGSMASIMLAHALLLFRRGTGFGARFAGAVLLCHSLILAARAVTAWGESPAAHRFDPSPMQTTYIMAFGVSILMLCVGVILMASERLRAELAHLATHDSLTGVFSRGALLDACRIELARASRHGRAPSMLLLDIDHFKSINDANGHLEGDRALVDFARCLSRHLRKGDVLGRFGGEEFLVLLPETSHQEALAIAERLRESVAQAGDGPRLTTSIGMTTAVPGIDDLNAVLARTDAALYRAKDLGRNRVVAA